MNLKLGAYKRTYIELSPVLLGWITTSKSSAPFLLVIIHWGINVGESLRPVTGYEYGAGYGTRRKLDIECAV